MKLFALITTLFLSVFQLYAVSADTLKVNVTVEVILPDSTRVKTTVNTPVPTSAASKTVPVAVQPRVEEPSKAVKAPKVAVKDSFPSLLAVAEPAIAHTPPRVASTVSKPSIKGRKRSDWNAPVTFTPRRARFAWGAEAGSSLDLSGQDMASIDIAASFGMTYRWISFLGVGASMNIMTTNSNRVYPIYLAFRTDFSRRVKLVFMDLRGGVALNYLTANINQTRPYGSAGIGFNLATGRTFRSYIIAAYSFFDRSRVYNAEGALTHDFKPLQMASLRLGIQF